MSEKDLLTRLQDDWKKDCSDLVKEIEAITAQFRCVDEISTNLQTYVTSVVVQIKREPVIENKVTNALKSFAEIQNFMQTEVIKRSNAINFKKGQLTTLNDSIKKINDHNDKISREKKRKEKILKKLNDGVDLSQRPVGQRPEKLKDIRNAKSELSLDANKTNKDS